MRSPSAKSQTSELYFYINQLIALKGRKLLNHITIKGIVINKRINVLEQKDFYQSKNCFLLSKYLHSATFGVFLSAYHFLCASGGIGRRARFRIWYFGVWVRVPPRAVLTKNHDVPLHASVATLLTEAGSPEPLIQIHCISHGFHGLTQLTEMVISEKIWNMAHFGVRRLFAALDGGSKKRKHRSHGNHLPMVEKSVTDFGNAGE